MAPKLGDGLSKMEANAPFSPPACEGDGPSRPSKQREQFFANTFFYDLIAKKKKKTNKNHSPQQRASLAGGVFLLMPFAKTAEIDSQHRASPLPPPNGRMPRVRAEERPPPPAALDKWRMQQLLPAHPSPPLVANEGQSQDGRQHEESVETFGWEAGGGQKINQRLGERRSKKKKNKERK
jgi:hypothetical protein